MATLSMPDAETKWAYSAIIDMLNDRDRSLADDAGFICGFTGLSKRRWPIIRAYLLREGYLVETGDGYLTNPRFERERAERIKAEQAAVEHGRKGGKMSAAKRAGQGEFDLNSDLSPVYPPVKPEINTTLSEDNSGVREQKPQKTAPKNQPPPQATRARKRLEARVDNDSDESLRTSTSRKDQPPEGVEPAVWADFLALRKRKRAPMTETALKGILREVAKAPGWTLNAALAECCERGWQGFKAEWVQSKGNGNGSNIQSRGQGGSGNRTALQRAIDEARDFLGGE